MAQQQKQASEERVAAASYVINFYKEVMEITNNFAVYSNLIVELEAKYSAVQVAEMNEVISETDKNTIKNTVQNVRYFAHKCYVQHKCMYNFLKSTKKVKDKNSITKYYEQIKNNYMIPRKDLEEFVIKLNEFLIDNVMKSLLESGQEIVDEIYS